MPHTSGTFEIDVTLEDIQEADEYGVGTARFSRRKAFSGGLSGQAAGTMLSVGTRAEGSASAYVAVDRFVGTLAGKSGGFALIYRGAVSRSDAFDMEIVIAPESGTGELEGITGALSIEVKDGMHHYSFTYALPSGSV